MRVRILKVIDQKTINTKAITRKKHLRYGKYITRSVNYLVDSSGVEVVMGQEIDIVSSKPISKSKKWVIKK